MKVANVYLKAGLAGLVGSIKFEAKAAVCRFSSPYSISTLNKGDLKARTLRPLTKAGLRLRGAFSAFRKYFTKTEGQHGLRYYFLRGFFENWREAQYSETLGEIAVPTRFSFLGIFNIQDTAQPHDLQDRDLWVEFATNVGEDLWTDPHTFSTEVDNFGVHMGRLKLIDYGGRETIPLLLEHRARFLESLSRLTRLVK
jgi:hypothetical protein